MLKANERALYTASSEGEALFLTTFLKNYKIFGRIDGGVKSESDKIVVWVSSEDFDLASKLLREFLRQRD